MYASNVVRGSWTSHVLNGRRPRRLGGGKGGEGREPREPKDPNKRMKAGLPPTALPGALGDR